MTDHERNQLLGDILGGDELNQVREASSWSGLKEMRRRRQRALAVRAGVLILPALLLVAGFFYPRIKFPQPAPKLVVTTPAVAASKVESINKEQLFALFPNRPMALVGRPGHQEVIFLDGHAAVSPQ
jgi:hypothetical protein